MWCLKAVSGRYYHAWAYMWCLKAVSGPCRLGLSSQSLASYSFLLHVHQLSWCSWQKLLECLHGFTCPHQMLGSNISSPVQSRHRAMTIPCRQWTLVWFCTMASKLLLRGLCGCLAMNGSQNPQQDVTTLWAGTSHLRPQSSRPPCQDLHAHCSWHFKQ
jgi:hypothetical protein